MRKNTLGFYIIVVVLLIGIVQTLPVLFLKPLGAKEMVGDNVAVYYEVGNEKGANEIFELLENNAEQLKNKMDFQGKELTKAYVYTKQESLWVRKYGFITVLGAPKWYVGDNKGKQVLVMSPYSKITGHNHDSILSAAEHELIHAINYQINPEMPYWIDNGIATYLSGQKPEGVITQYGKLPEMNDLKSENQSRFGNTGGYQYSYTYIEYLNESYGWDKVVELAKGKKAYEAIFGKTDAEIYNEWISYIKENYL